MQTAAPIATTIDKKIQELCETLIADSGVQNAREQAETFLADEEAVSLYREMATLGRSIHQKQHNGEEPTDVESRRFTDLQNRCEAHPTIAAFLEAQEVLGGIAERVNKYVGKSLERGQVPSESEVNGGGCGEGCGCHH